MRASKYDQEIPPTPEEIQQEYESTKEQYRDLTKDKIKFKKIFIPMLGDDSASTPEVQLNLAELIAKEIKSKNATFEEMAKRYSKDLYAEKGGDWPVTERSTLSPESAAIIFGAQPGEIIGPLVDSTGFTIVLVEKKELAPPPPLSAIKEQIDIMARNKRSNERYKNGWNASGKSHRQNIYLILLLSPLPDRPIQQGRSGVLSFIPPVFLSANRSVRSPSPAGGIFLSPISPEDAFIHNWTAAASHPA